MIESETNSVLVGINGHNKKDDVRALTGICRRIYVRVDAGA